MRPSFQKIKSKQNKNKVGGLTFPHFEMYYKAMIIKQFVTDIKPDVQTKGWEWWHSKGHQIINGCVLRAMGSGIRGDAQEKWTACSQWMVSWTLSWAHSLGARTSLTCLKIPEWWTLVDYTACLQKVLCRPHTNDKVTRRRWCFCGKRMIWRNLHVTCNCRQSTDAWCSEDTQVGSVDALS